jgi:hypothetical protein
VKIKNLILTCVEFLSVELGSQQRGKVAMRTGPTVIVRKADFIVREISIEEFRTLERYL